MYHEKQVRERCSEIGTISISRFLLWREYVLAARAVDLNSCDFQILTNANRQGILLLAQYSGTGSESSCQKAFSHDGESLRSCYVAGMDEPIKFGGMLIYLQKSMN